MTGLKSLRAATELAAPPPATGLAPVVQRRLHYCVVVRAFQVAELVRVRPRIGDVAELVRVRNSEVSRLLRRELRA